jgi:hypothetical protein
MKSIFWNSFLNLYLVIFRLYGRWILKCKIRLAGAVFLKTYIKAFDLFPEKTLKYYFDVANVANKKIFDYAVFDDDSDIESGDVDTLYDSAMSDKWVRGTVFNYHLVDALYYSYGISTDLFKGKSEEAICKARKIDPNARPIDTNSVATINKEIKRDIKILKSEIKKLNTDKVESEKAKLIQPITVRGAHLAFAASIFSALLLISGFSYNKIFFNHFDIEVGDFFSAADYVSSSVDAVVAAAISTVLGVLFFLWGFSGALSRRLHEQQFETERKGADYLVPTIVFTSSVGLVLTAVQTGEVSTLYLYPLILFLVIELVPRMPVWKYIRNKELVGAVLISAIYFSLHLGRSIHDRIADITSGDYSGPYVLQYEDEYKGHLGSEFVSANSSYVFLWNNENGVISIIPKEGVSEFRAK